MIKKTLRNAAVGTIAASAMILPAATTVAPSVQLVACQYNDTKDTSTKQELSEYAISRGAVTSFVSVKSLDGGTPRGTITVTRTGPGKDKSKSRTLRDGDTSASFRFGGFGKKKEGTYKFTATFIGFCRFSNSSDVDHLVVTR